MTTRRALVKDYLRRNVHNGEFELHSKIKSNYYIDVRPLFLDSLIAYDVLMLLLTHLHPDIQHIGGIERSGFIIVPGLISISQCHPLKGVLIRKIRKQHGLCRLVEGSFIPEGSEIALVDDLITTGASLEFATQAVQEEYKAKVVQWLVLVDRTEGKVKTPYPLTKVFTAEEILAD